MVRRGDEFVEFRGSVGGDRIKFSPEAAKNGYTIGGLREMVS